MQRRLGTTQLLPLAAILDTEKVCVCAHAHTHARSCLAAGMGRAVSTWMEAGRQEKQWRMIRLLHGSLRQILPGAASV